MGNDSPGAYNVFRNHASDRSHKMSRSTTNAYGPSRYRPLRTERRRMPPWWAVCSDVGLFGKAEDPKTKLGSLDLHASCLMELGLIKASMLAQTRSSSGTGRADGASPTALPNRRTVCCRDDPLRWKVLYPMLSGVSLHCLSTADYRATCR
jgi:hypothetical protein